jgi:hypothetical protein
MLGGARIRELERHERKEESSRGPAPEPLRICRRRLPRSSCLVPRPRNGVGRGAPRAQDRPQVPEDDHERHEPEPENDPDERRREIVAGVGLADERRQPDHHQQTGGESAENDPPAHPEKQPLPARRQQAPSVTPFE